MSTDMVDKPNLRLKSSIAVGQVLLQLWTRFELHYKTCVVSSISAAATRYAFILGQSYLYLT